MTENRTPDPVRVDALLDLSLSLSCRPRSTGWWLFLATWR